MKFRSDIAMYLFCFIAFCIYHSELHSCRGRNSRLSIAPDFTLFDQDCHKVTLSQLLKSYKYVVLIFYPQDDSFICTKQMCQLRDIYDNIPSDILLLGISSDSSDQHKKFIQKYQLPFNLLSDTGNTVRTLYDAYTYGFHARVTLVIRNDGIITESYSNMYSLREHIELIRRLSSRVDTAS